MWVALHCPSKPGSSQAATWSAQTSMRMPCFEDITCLAPVKYIAREQRCGKDEVTTAYSQNGKGEVFPNGHIHKPWRMPSRTWCEVQDMNTIQGRKHQESLSLKRCIVNLRVRTTAGITVEQCRKGLRGRVSAAFKDRDLARKKWSTSITEAKNPANTISLKSVVFLTPMTIAQDHMPIAPCTALSERARSQGFC